MGSPGPEGPAPARKRGDHPWPPIRREACGAGCQNRPGERATASHDSRHEGRTGVFLGRCEPCHH
jgi:hypothetical protein